MSSLPSQTLLSDLVSSGPAPGPLRRDGHREAGEHPVGRRPHSRSAAQEGPRQSGESPSAFFLLALVASLLLPPASYRLPPASLSLTPVPQASCDGGGGALGHPKIFINLDTGKPESCNYCGLRFEMEPHH